MSKGRHNKTFLIDGDLRFYLEIMLEELQDNHLLVSLVPDQRGDFYRKLRAVDTVNICWYQCYCHAFQRKTKKGKHQEHNHYTIINRKDTVSLLVMLIKKGYSFANPEKVIWLIEEAKLLKEKWDDCEEESQKEN